VQFEDLKGKACLVTGASRGIGAAIARGLGRCGAHVAVHYRSGRKEAEQVAADIAAAGGKSVLVAGDVAERGGAGKVVEAAVAALGRLDILINNAGDQITRCPIVDTPDELFDRQIDTNVRSVFEACRAGVRQMRQQGQDGSTKGGVIINVGSIAGRTGGGIGSQIYAGAKAFVATFSRSLAKEVVADRIRVNVLSPGVIATDMQDRVSTPAQIAATVTTIPMGRVGTGEDCVGTCLYLCSDAASSYVTGQMIEVNGGLLMP
jgi:3-oxoacyl-[acyl-carrier protein] reductase